MPLSSSQQRHRRDRSGRPARSAMTQRRCAPGSESSADSRSRPRPAPYWPARAERTAGKCRRRGSSAPATAKSRAATARGDPRMLASSGSCCARRTIAKQHFLNRLQSRLNAASRLTNHRFGQSITNRLAMSEARSLTPLSEKDYETIAAAVMETARGPLVHGRIRQAQPPGRHGPGAVGAIAAARTGRRHGARKPQPPEPDLREAAALIADLRLDLERISGRSETRVLGPRRPHRGRRREHRDRDGEHSGSRLEPARSRRRARRCATSSTGAPPKSTPPAARSRAPRSRSPRSPTPSPCSTAACARFASRAGETGGARMPGRATPRPSWPTAAPLSHYEDIEVVEIDAGPVSVLAEAAVRLAPPGGGAEAQHAVAGQRRHRLRGNPRDDRCEARGGARRRRGWRWRPPSSPCASSTRWPTTRSSPISPDRGDEALHLAGVEQAVADRPRA